MILTEKVDHKNAGLREGSTVQSSPGNLFFY